jgi:hypothetical protein
LNMPHNAQAATNVSPHCSHVPRWVSKRVCLTLPLQRTTREPSSAIYAMLAARHFCSPSPPGVVERSEGCPDDMGCARGATESDACTAGRSVFFERSRHASGRQEPKQEVWAVKVVVEDAWLVLWRTVAQTTVQAHDYRRPTPAVHQFALFQCLSAHRSVLAQAHRWGCHSSSSVKLLDLC